MCTISNYFPVVHETKAREFVPLPRIFYFYVMKIIQKVNIFEIQHANQQKNLLHISGISFCHRMRILTSQQPNITNQYLATDKLS